MWVEHYFPSAIYQNEHEDPSSLDLTSKILDWSRNSDGINKSNVGGWHSTDDMHEREEFKEITEWIKGNVENVGRDICLREDMTLEYDNMWANVNNEGHYNKTHNHPCSDISGVYYVRVPKPEAKIWFHDPRTAFKMNPIMRSEESHKRPELWSDVHFTPKPGMLLLFPSWLDHSVDKNVTRENRISISFNFRQTRVIYN